jgi:hypothetical protein
VFESTKRVLISEILVIAQAPIFTGKMPFIFDGMAGDLGLEATAM